MSSPAPRAVHFARSGHLKSEGRGQLGPCPVRACGRVATVVGHQVWLPLGFTAWLALAILLEGRMKKPVVSLKENKRTQISLRDKIDPKQKVNLETTTIYSTQIPASPPPPEKRRARITNHFESKKKQMM